MAAGSQYYTAGEICDMITDDNHEFWFPGSDDDFDIGDLQEDLDALDREQGKDARQHSQNLFQYILTAERD